MAVVALVALIVMGPKELPQALRAASKWVRKARSLAREFQSGVDDMIREADLDDARKAVETTKNFDVTKVLDETIDPTGDVRGEAADLERTARSDPPEPDRAVADQASTSDEPATPEMQATVVEHPLQVAPAHSLSPPAEDTASVETGAEDTSKRA